MELFLVGRRHAARRLFVLLALGVTLQVVGLLVPGDQRLLEGALVLGPYPILMLATGLLVPRPPAGFFPNRRSGPRPVTGFDALAVATVAVAVAVAPQWAAGAWLSRFELSVMAAVAVPLIAFGGGGVLALGVLELRDRQHTPR